MNIKDVIRDKIRDAYFKFQKHEHKIVEVVQEMGCEYIENRERPIAAFIMEKISTIDKIDAINELPLHGLGEDKVKEFKKKVLGQMISQKKIGKITKRYTRYEIDGAVFEDNSNNFIEFKISDSPAKARAIDFVQDYLKYRIYTSSNTSEGIPTNFFYINLFKEKKFNFPKSNLVSKQDDYYVLIDDWQNIDWKEVKKRNIIIINSWGIEDKTSEYLSDRLITLSIYQEINSELEGKYDNKIGDLKKELESIAKGETIYGRNVVFSKKMKRNFNSIYTFLLDLAEKAKIIESKNSISWDDLRNIIKIEEADLTAVRNVYLTLNNDYFDKERKERPSTKSIIQKTNYLLAFIEVSLKKEDCWNNDIEFDFSISDKEKDEFMEAYVELLARCKKVISECGKENAHISIIKHLLFLYSSFFELNQENVLEPRSIFKAKKTIQKYNEITKKLVKNINLDLDISDEDSIREIENRISVSIFQDIHKLKQK